MSFYIKESRGADSVSCPSTFPQEVDEVKLQNDPRYVVEVMD